MKKKIIILAVIGVFSILFINTNISLNAAEKNSVDKVGRTDSSVVVDSNLRTCVESAIPIGGGMEDITGLICDSVDITTLEGLQYASNITQLEINNSGDSLEDISQLSSLRNLTYLSLEGHSIEDISPLSSLTNLTHLELSVNNIEDISSLSGLTNLTYLQIPVNEIEDVSPLSSLINLTHLELESNHISNVSSLESLLTINGGQLNSLNVGNEKIYLPDITVSTADEIFTTVTDANNIEYTISLGIPTNGTSTLSATFNYDGVLGLSTDIFNGTIYQNVTYGSSTGSGGGGSTGSGGGGSSHNSKYPPNIILSKHEITLLKDSAEPRWKNYIVKVLDDDDNLTANDVVVTEDVDMSEVGEYTVHYKVTDSDNLSDEDDLIVTIVETEEELPVEDTDEEVVEDIDNTNDNEIEKDEIIKNDDVEEEQLTNTANTNMITIILIGILGLLSFIIIERKVK